MLLVADFLFAGLWVDPVANLYFCSIALRASHAAESVSSHELENMCHENRINFANSKARKVDFV